MITNIESRKNRIHSLDLLRGVAVLGILLMNITSFSQAGPAYMNPTLGAGLEGYNQYFWNFNWLFADMKFMSIFSILFGAGIVLFSDNAAKKGYTVWKLKYKRLFFLLLFGLIHAYFIWSGDILVAYSLCGFLVFLFRNFKIRTLIILASIFFVIPGLISMAMYYGLPANELLETFNFWDESPSKIDLQVSAYLGSYWDQMPYRVTGALEMQTVVFIFETFWRVTGLMIIGMILYKLDILSAQKSNAFYKKLAIYGLVSGLIISGIGLYGAYQHNWEAIYSMVFGRMSNYFGSLPMALGYIGLVMLFAKSDRFAFLKISLQMTGKMAFTNYIGMSIVCSFIFYGIGLGLYNKVNRLEQFLIVLLIWALMLMISPIVLSRFRYGPLEWFWRKLTYTKFW